MRNSAPAWMAGFAVFLCAPLMRAQVLIHQSFPAGPHVCAVAAADFNLDKKLDVIYLDSTGIAVALGNGDATFNAPVRTTARQSPCGLVTGDFNRDGKLDVITVAGQFLAGKGDGAFAPPAELGFSGLMAVADFNGDGKLDLAVGLPCSATGCDVNTSLPVNVLLGNGDGTFQAPIRLGSNVGSFGIAAADFNGDGAMDMAVLSNIVENATDGGKAYSRFVRRAEVMFGDGRGGFSPAKPAFETYFSDSATQTSLAAADLNKDGRADLVVSGELSVDVLLAKADGTFTLSYSTTMGNVFNGGLGGSAVVIGDFDGDGNVDVLFGTDFDSIFDLDLGVRQRVVWHRGRSDGTFAIRDTSSIPAPAGLAAGDFDGDGIVDAVAISPVVNAFSIFRRADTLPAAAVISMASGADLVTSGSLASVSSPAIASGSKTAQASTLPLSLAGAVVEVVDARGTKMAAGLSAVVPGQIDFQIPEGTAPGPAILVVHQESAGDVSANFAILPAAPALFVTYDFSPTNLRPAAYFVRVEANGSQTQIPAITCTPSPSFFEPACRLNPQVVDSRPLYLVLFGTGIARRRALDAVRCRFGGISLPVEYAGPSSMPGVDQVNVRLSPGLPNRVALEIDGVISNAVDVQFR